VQSYVWRFSQLSFALFLLFVPVFVYWASKVRFGSAYVEDWLPYDDASRIAYREFRQRFGSDQYLLISWRGCTLEDPRLENLAEKLRTLASSQEVQTAEELQIEAVEDSRGSVETLASALQIEISEAAERLSGVSIGENGTAFIAIRLGLGAVTKHSRLIGIAQQLAAETGIDAEDLVLAGEAYQIHMIDRSSRESMQYYVPPSSLLALLAAWYCLRSIRLTLLVFTFAGFGQVLGMALIAYTIGEMSAVMVVLPTLVFMLTLSAAVHLANYYRDAIHEIGHAAGDAYRSFPSIRALRLGWRPCAMAAATTVIGFASLIVSQLDPVWRFGALAGVGLAVSTLVLLSCFPAACRLIVGDTIVRRAVARGVRFPDSRSVHDPSALEAAGIQWLLTRIVRSPAAISAAGVLLLMLAVLGLLRLKTSTEFDDMFGEQSRAVKNVRWLEANLGPLNSLEFQLQFENCNDDYLLERLSMLKAIADELLQSQHVTQVYSALTLLPDIPRQVGMRGTFQRSILKRKVLANMHVLRDSQLWTRDEAGETWRLSVRIPELRSDNFYLIQDELMARCEPSIDSAAIEHAQVSMSVSGLRAVVETAHQTLLGDLAGSFSAAFLLITPVMMLITRGFFSGLLLMIPNLLPVALVFGCMGWLGIRLDVASILTASVALGIAVDDTLHYLSWYLRARRQGSSATPAVAAAMQACGRPMLHTTLICTAAMLPFLFSDFIPTAKFALLMILTLSGAIIGDLVLLPSLLLSPVGKLLNVKTP
jgi:uncharacterized protein